MGCTWTQEEGPDRIATSPVDDIGSARLEAPRPTRPPALHIRTDCGRRGSGAVTTPERDGTVETSDRREGESEGS